MITFQNQLYPVREIFLPKFGDVLITTQSLNEKLFNVDYQYVSNEAEHIDNQIFYYVENDKINLPHLKLSSILNGEIS